MLLFTLSFLLHLPATHTQNANSTMALWLRGACLKAQVAPSPHRSPSTPTAALPRPDRSTAQAGLQTGLNGSGVEPAEQQGGRGRANPLTVRGSQEEPGERPSLTCECSLLAVRQYCSPESQPASQAKRERLSKGKAGFLDWRRLLTGIEVMQDESDHGQWSSNVVNQEEVSLL